MPDSISKTVVHQVREFFQFALFRARFRGNGLVRNARLLNEVRNLWTAVANMFMRVGEETFRRADLFLSQESKRF